MGVKKRSDASDFEKKFTPPFVVKKDRSEVESFLLVSMLTEDVMERGFGRNPLWEKG